jgi:hypothetical protein
MAGSTHIQDHPRDLMVLLMNAEHVKFGMGAPARLERVLQAMDVKTPRGRGGSCAVCVTPTVYFMGLSGCCVCRQAKSSPSS